MIRPRMRLVVLLMMLCLVFGQTGARADIAAWGWNDDTQLGDGTGVWRDSPVPVLGPTDFVYIAADYNHSLGLRPDGTVWAWGDNYYGELGDGTFTRHSVPTQVPGLSGVVAVRAGERFSLALKSDGTVWAWGNNIYGQIGNGTTTDQGTPMQVPGLSNVVAIDTGSYHSIVKRADGTYWGWGLNVYGSLGNGTSTFQYQNPVPIPALTGAVSVKCANYHNFALMPDGTVLSWGQNWHGQLGIGTATPISTQQPNLPQLVPGLTNIVSIDGGEYHSVALDSLGRVWSWGRNDRSQLGDGTNVDRYLPGLVTGLPTIVELSSGGFHTIARSQNGQVFTWGANNFGQLGDGTYADQSTPVTVSGLPNPTFIIAGFYHNFAFFSVNRAPIAHAGPDIFVRCGQNALLDGSQSSDPDGDTLAYAWYEGSTLLSNEQSPTLSLKAGTHTLTLTVTDPSGLSNSDTVVVTIEPLGFKGFLSPIGGADATGGSFANPLLCHQYGSALPVKFRLTCCKGDVLVGVHTLQAIKYTSATVSNPPINATSTDCRTQGNQFRLTGNQWHFNLDTRFLSKGTWKLVATLSDGSTHTVWIKLK